MKAQITDLTLGIDGQWRLTLTTQDDIRALWDTYNGTDINVDIKKWFAKRSHTANSYLWALIDSLAVALRMSKTDIYRQAIREIGGVSTTVCVKDLAADALASAWQERGIGWIADRYESKLPGCTNLRLYYGSSMYDTAQMAQLIDQIVDECKDAGIETMPPEELNALKESWKA